MESSLSKVEKIIIQVLGAVTMLVFGGFLIGIGLWPVAALLWGIGVGTPLIAKIVLKTLNSSNKVKSKNRSNNEEYKINKRFYNEGDTIYPEKYKKEDLSRIKTNTKPRYEYERELLNSIDKPKVLTLTKNKKSIDK